MVGGSAAAGRASAGRPAGSVVTRDATGFLGSGIRTATAAGLESDLISGRGRTQVNGQATREHVLRPGDVIALSDVMIIYGEGADNRANGHNDQEQASSVTLTRDTPLPKAAPPSRHDP